jgi:hypothetical protein
MSYPYPGAPYGMPPGMQPPYGMPPPGMQPYGSARPRNPDSTMIVGWEHYARVLSAPV